MPENKRLTDLTRGPILRGILLFALPVILGNFMQEMYQTADMLIVGRTLGVLQLAAIGATGSLSFLATGFVIGSAGGFSIPIAQHFGAGDREEVRRAIAADLVIAAAEALLMTLVFVLLTKPFLRMLHTPSDTIEEAEVYLRIIYAGLSATVLYNTLASILRACGNSRTPLLFLIVSSVLNIVLDLICIVWLKLGVAGAALATVAAQLLSGVLCLRYFSVRFPELRPEKRHFEALAPRIRTALKVGIPLGLQMSMISLGVMVLSRVVNSFGSNAVAAQAVGSRVQRIIEIFTTGLGTVMATYVGQNYGARDFGRIRKGVLQIWVASLIFLLAVPGLTLLLRESIIGLFLKGGEPEALAYADLHLRCICPFMWILSFLHIYRGAVTGLGKGMASFAGGVGELVMRVAISLLLAGTFGYAAIAATGPAAWVVSATMMVWVFYKTVRQKEGEEAGI